jgi:vacuolar-type H+-ATPase subunit F/Vma7
MARAAVIGDSLRICGYGLAGAVLCPAADQRQALRGWQALPADIAVVVLTSQAADWLSAELAQRPDLLHVVLPDPPGWSPS